MSADTFARAKTCIGLHVLKKTCMAKSISNTRKKHPINSVQIFTHGPRNSKEVSIDHKKLIDAVDGINLYIHSSYPTNPWNDKLCVMEHTIDQFRVSSVLGAVGVVLHIPKLGPDEVAETVKKINDILCDEGINNQKIILEMKAVSQHDTMSYESPEKINRLIDRLVSLDIDYTSVGICIDTAHIYAGKANIRSYDDAVSYLEKIVDSRWICLFHINGNVYDSTKRAGDKHAVPFYEDDKIWYNVPYDISGCRAFIEYSKQNSIDFILEVKQQHTDAQIEEFTRIINAD